MLKLTCLVIRTLRHDLQITLQLQTASVRAAASTVHPDRESNRHVTPDSFAPHRLHRNLFYYHLFSFPVLSPVPSPTKSTSLPPNHSNSIRVRSMPLVSPISDRPLNTLTDDFDDDDAAPRPPRLQQDLLLATILAVTTTTSAIRRCI